MIFKAFIQLITALAVIAGLSGLALSQHDDLEAARSRARRIVNEQLLKEAEGLVPVPIEELEEPPKPEPEALAVPPQRRVEVVWSTSSPAPAASPVVVTYLVSEKWCPNCPAAERNLQSKGITYRKITINEAVAMGEQWGNLRNGQRVYTVPHTFTRNETVSTPVDPTVSAEVRGGTPADLGAVAIPLLVQHLEAQSASTASTEAGKLTGGMFDIDVNLPTLYPELLSALFVKQQWSSSQHNLSLDWRGQQKITNESGKLTLSPPIKIQKAVGIFGVKATLETIEISDDGRRLTLGLGGSPDLTITIKSDNQQTSYQSRDHPQLLNASRICVLAP